MLQLTEPLSILTPPFPFPFSGTDDGEIWTSKNYLLLIEVCPQGVPMPENMPSFRFQYAAHFYNMSEFTSRPVATYTLEQICFSETLADTLLRDKKDQYFHSDGCYLGPFFFTRYLPGEHKNYGGVAYAGHDFSDDDKNMFRSNVVAAINNELEFGKDNAFTYTGSSMMFGTVRAKFSTESKTNSTLEKEMEQLISQHDSLFNILTEKEV